MSHQPQQAKSIFLAAADKPPDERGVFLDQACGENSLLRRHVEQLLYAFDHQPVSTLTDQLPELPMSGGLPSVTAEKAGTLVGPYKLLKQIGEGGMGSVWMAEQAHPVRRTVALKLIRVEIADSQSLARFEAERQALALMDHPHIAKVLDAGTTDTGRPFFAMEMVKGKPITKYCDEQRLTLRQRLELFIPVCLAVQHAHQKGIIHRDLKPSNVLVASIDGEPVVKVIDFGVAKATGQKLTDRTMFTDFGALIGTLEYMSPEQARLESQDIDTRSDIYSLGVILYELLTGSTPLTWQRVADAQLIEILRVIREEEPPRPSTRLNQSATLATVASQRRTEPVKLSRLLRGDLDWLVMKALEKDRGQRYETANGLAQDIQRYLADEPILAGPPSATYRLRKFAKRNKGALAAIAVVLVALIVGLIGTTWGLFEAQKQQSAAEQEKQVAESQRDRAIKAESAARANEEKATAEEARARLNEKKAQAELDRALKAETEKRLVLDFFQDNVIAAARPQGVMGGLGIEVSLRAAVDAASSRIAETFHDKPIVEASLRHVMGMSYFYLGDHKRAILQHELALKLRQSHLPTNHHDTLTSMNDLALAYKEAGRLADAIALFEKTLALRQAIYGENHFETLSTMNNLGAAYILAGRSKDAVALLEKTQELRDANLSIEHPDRLHSLRNLAEAYRASGNLKEALPMLEESLALCLSVLGKTHPETLISKNNLASAYFTDGRYSDALPHFEDAFKWLRSRLGPSHPHTLICLNNLALTYQAVGHLDKALPLFEELNKQVAAAQGADHPDTLRCMTNLATAYQDAGRLKEAITLFEKSLELHKKKQGADHPETLTNMNNLAWSYHVAGRNSEAMTLFEQTLALYKQKLGNDHPNTLMSMNNLAYTYQAADRLEEAAPLYEYVIKFRKLKLGVDHPDTLGSMHNLATCYESQGQLDKAESLFRTTVDLARGRQGIANKNTRQFVVDLAHFYERKNAADKAEPLWRELAEYWSEKEGLKSPMYASQLAALGQNLLRQKRFAEGETLLRECLAIRQEKLPDDWSTFNTQSTLGAALLGQSKYADAEPLLLKGYEGMKERVQQIPAPYLIRLTEAIERIVQLYEAIGDSQKASQWREILEKKK